MAHDPLVQRILTALDTHERAVTDWEASFLESLLRQTFPLTGKQRQVLARMAEQYLTPALAAELLGQQRLFPGVE
jgi:hypothetical protein